MLIGTAIVGDAHRPGAGPGIILSFVLSGVTCALAALCYAEFAAMIPRRGQRVYVFVCDAGRVSRLDYRMEFDFGVWGGLCGRSHRLVRVPQQYFENEFGIELPHWATHAPGSDGGVANLPAAIIVLLVTAVLVRGVEESARATGMIVMVKIAVILFLLPSGRRLLSLRIGCRFMPYGFQGVGAAAAIIFFAYIEFDAVSTTAEEARNPQRDIPIGIIASLIICTVLYVVVAAILTGIIPYAQIDVHAPVAEALRLAGFHWGAAIVATGAVARNHKRALCHDDRADPGLFCHVSRWAVRAMALQRASAILGPRIMRRFYRVGIAALAAFIPNRRSGRYDQHRDLIRLCPGLRRRAHSAAHSSRIIRDPSAFRSCPGFPCWASPPASGSWHFCL